MELSGRLYDKQIARATLKILFDNLNDKMDEMELLWDSEDDDFLTSVNRGVPDWSIEHIKDENFFEGNMPGLINSPIENYPNISVFCHDANPTNSSDDAGELYSITMDIEMIAKSGSFMEEYDFNLAQLVSMRLQRMKESVMLVLLENRTLNNTVSEIAAPRVTIGDVFVRREEKGKNPKFYWQGAVLRYNVYKYVNMR